MTMTAMPPELRFGNCGVRLAERQLLVNGEPVRLGARAFDVLVALIERRDRTVSKSELFELVWPDVVVEENNLQVHVSAIRRLLGPQAIATVPGRGYRFTLLQDNLVPPDPATARAEAPAPAPRLKTNLPERLPPLIGRDDDLAALRTLLDAHPLVTISGAGGTGKTLLAQHVLTRQDREPTHGVCWVELATDLEPAALAPTIAGALGLPLDTGDPASALLKACAPLSILLALDNAEHLVSDVALLAQRLLGMAPGVRLLVTSQAPLKLSQERLYRLGPMQVPEEDVPAADALTYGAVALFAARAQAADRHFSVHEGNVAEVSALCRRLDGSALGIELAAARLPLLGLSRLAASLDERLRLLTKGSRSAPMRQRTLRAALEWSHDLLDEAQQIVFRRFAVFVDSAALEHVQDVVSDGHMDRWQVLDALDALVDRSLVALTSHEPPRYRMLESPRALAKERLAASGEQAVVSERHARSVVARLVAARAAERGLPSSRRIAELEPDLGNARAALAWALSNDPAATVAMAPGLAMVLGRTRYEELSALWRATCACLREDQPPALRAEWTQAAAGHLSDRHPTEARELARQAVTLYRTLDDPIGLYLALCMLAQSRRSGEGDEARHALAELRRIEQPDWSPGVRVFGAQAEAFVAYYAEDWVTAVATLQRLEALGERAGSLAAGPVVRTNLVDLTLHLGKADEAVRLGRALEQDLLGTRSLQSLTFARVNLTRALLATNDVPSARATAVAAWPDAQRFDLHLFWIDVLTLLAALEGRHHTAARLRGHGDQGHAHNAELRRRGEADAVQRAEALGRAALGDDVFGQLTAEGRAMSLEAINDVILASTDGFGPACTSP